MNCPACNGERFKQVGNSVYCVSLVKGKLCGVTLKGELRREYFVLHASKKDRRKYFAEYKRRHRINNSDGMLLSEIAIIKFCHRDTVYKNISKFDVIKNSHPLRIKFNRKVFDWIPKNVKCKM